MNEQVLKVFSRLSKDADGMGFINYLKELSKDNYEAYKRSRDTHSDSVHKGYALAIDNLIKVFETCDDTLIKQTIEDITPHCF